MSKCRPGLDYLYGKLPERFTPALDEVRGIPPTLLSGKHSLFLTHSDLNEMNVAVDIKSGYLKELLTGLT